LELRNGVHKYKTYFQAEFIVQGFDWESTNIN